ncbi:hypothetical protein DIPPA_18199 [Diplonema papillatum]|nr:hypothetical protein DIPPA_18199 [Diplonema papillatum]
MMLQAVLLSAVALSTWGTGGHGNGGSSYPYTLPGDRRWPKLRHWAKLEARLEGNLAVRGSQGYNLTELYQDGIFNRRNGEPQPAAIAVPNGADDVRRLVLFGRRHQLRVAVYNRGHMSDVRNTADNSLLIHIAGMKGVSVDMDELTVTVEGGASFNELVPAVDAASNGTYVALSGSVGTIGVWGWAVAGGFGPLTQMYGFGVDAIVSATVVTAEGAVVTATADNEHKDLLYAIRGGASTSFGIGVSLTMRLFPNPGPAMSVFVGTFPVVTPAITEGYAAALKTAPHGAILYYLIANPGTLRINAFCFGSSCPRFMAAVNAIPGCTSCINFPSTFPLGFLGMFSGASMERYSQWTMGGAKLADVVPLLTDVAAWVEQPEEVAMKKDCWGGGYLGGMSSFFDPEGCSTAISPGMRASRLYLVCLTSWDESLDAAGRQKAVDTVTTFEDEKMRPRSPSEWVYWNEAHHEFLGDSWKVRYWGSMETYNKLLRIKLRYDPTNFLTCYHCVGWDYERSVADVDPNLCPSTNCSCSNNPTGECSTF